MSEAGETKPPRRRRRLRLLLSGAGGALALGVGVVAFGPFGQRVDRSYRPSVAIPRYPAEHPIVCIDEGHWNAHTAGGRLRPLAWLIEADGYRAVRHRGRFTARSLLPCRILVIANAAGGSRFTIGPFNLPIKRGGERNAAAFGGDEIRFVRAWVARGGSLLLAADHAPFGEASRGLAAAFGVEMGGGFVEVPRGGSADGGPGRLLFSTRNRLLRPHAITAGLRRVMSFTGQSLGGAGEPLLQLPGDAVEYVPPGPVLKGVSAAGRRQALAMEVGKGRVAVLGEVGMISAQIDNAGRPMGMNVKGIDNQAFALNLFQWLSRAI